MEDRFGKYIQLSFNLFFTFIGFVVALILVLLGLRLLFGVLDHVPWFVYMYMLLIILVPPALFIAVYWIYLKRTAFHPSKPVRAVSYVILGAALLAWIVFLVLDIITFFKTNSRIIAHYYGYNILFLSINIFSIFLVGIIQALSVEKEKDWMERRREKEDDNGMIY